MQERGCSMFPRSMYNKEAPNVPQAAVGSGAVDTAGNPNAFSGATIKEPRESKSQECWIPANGDEIPTLGEINVRFQTSDGQHLKRKAKAGEVSKTLTSVSRLLEAGFATNLST